MEIGDKGGEARNYGNQGRVLYSLGEYQKAKEYLEKALAINMEIGDKGGEASNYGNLGNILHSLGEYQKAKECHEKALAISIEIGDKGGEARNYGNRGSVLHRLGEYQKAKDLHEKALAINMEIGDKGGKARNYGNLGSVLHSLGEYQKAKEFHEKALAINVEMGDKEGEARNYGNLGNVFESFGEHQKAKEFHDKALAINVEICDKEGEARNYGNLGNVFESFGEHQKAKEFHDKALTIYMKIGGKNGEARSYRNLGNVLRSLGEIQKAKEYQEKSLAINIEIGDKKEEARNYGNLGNVFTLLGEYQKAKEFYAKALAINVEIGNKKGEASNYRNLGNVLNSLGECQKAEEYYAKALVINVAIGNKKEEASNYGDLGNVFNSRGKYLKAKEYLEKALSIVKKIGDKGGEARIYENLGDTLIVVGEYQKAKDYHMKALDINIEIGDKLGQARCYLEIGQAYVGLRKFRDTKEYGEKALSIALEVGDRQSQAQAFGILGSVSEWVHDYPKAKESYEKQVAISGEIGHRKTAAKGYILLGKVSIIIGAFDRADEYLEKARVISCDVGYILGEFNALLCLSVLRLSQSKALEAFSYLHQCTAKYETLRNFQQGNEEFQVGLLESHGTSPYTLLSSLLCAVGSPRDAIYVEELRRARCLADLMARNFSVRNHITPDPKSWCGMEEIVSKEGNSDFLYISYYARRVSLWVLKANGDILIRQSEEVDDETLRTETAFDLNSLFNKSLHRFGILLSQKCEDRSFSETIPMSLRDANEEDLKSKDSIEIERRLSVCFKMIIAPVADLLTEPEIIIVPERSLYRVPFAALRDKPGGKCLADTFRIRIVPSLTTLKVIQDCPADYHSQTGALLVVGDPLVGKAYYRGRIHDFEPLVGAKKEAEIVGKLLGVQPLLGEGARKDVILGAVSSVSLIHIAAHGDVDRGEIALSPSSSSSSNIPEEDDYLLTISDISKVKLRAKLVVLSCCHSGRGEIKVEGVIGIGRTFLASGARSVLVTLWDIEDEATLQFMGHFYKHLVDGLSASECLHQAMKWMRINGFSKIHQWAPFMLIGDNATFDFTKQRLVLFQRIK